MLPRWLALCSFVLVSAGACEVAVDPAPRPTSTVVAVPSPQTIVLCSPPYPFGPPSVETVFCTDPATLQPAPLLRVVDGDTIHVEIDGRDETVRFYGIDTPERGDPCFAEATARTEGELEKSQRDAEEEAKKILSQSEKEVKALKSRIDKVFDAAVQKVVEGLLGA